jgi:hypothetical protein
MVNREIAKSRSLGLAALAAAFGVVAVGAFAIGVLSIRRPALRLTGDDDLPPSEQPRID